MALTWVRQSHLLPPPLPPQKKKNERRQIHGEAEVNGHCPSPLPPATPGKLSTSLSPAVVVDLASTLGSTRSSSKLPRALGVVPLERCGSLREMRVRVERCQVHDYCGRFVRGGGCRTRSRVEALLYVCKKIKTWCVCCVCLRRKNKIPFENIYRGRSFSSFLFSSLRKYNVFVCHV